MHANARTAIVVGAGIFGVTGALELAARGWKVRLMDPGPLPHPKAATTDISKLVRADYGSDEFYTSLAEEALKGWEAWNRVWRRPLYHEVGFLLLSRDGMEPGTFEHDSWRVLTRRGRELRRLDPTLLRTDFPAWARGGFQGGYFNPWAGWAESGRILEKLIADARRAGIQVVGQTFARLMESGGRVTGVRTADGTDHEANAVVVAGGAWTPALLPELRDVMWATGQPVLHFRVEGPKRWQPPGFPPWAADISRTGWYGFPALADGTLKIGHHGAGRRMDPDDLRVVGPEWEERCREFLTDAVPELADLPLVDTRLCLYCDTFDSDFWIDEDPERPGLVVATGGSGHGFKFAPVLGGLVADAVEGRNHPRRGRFRWRPRSEIRTEAARAEG